MLVSTFIQLVVAFETRHIYFSLVLLTFISWFILIETSTKISTKLYLIRKREKKDQQNVLFRNEIKNAI